MNRAPHIHSSFLIPNYLLQYLSQHPDFFVEAFDIVVHEGGGEVVSFFVGCFLYSQHVVTKDFEVCENRSEGFCRGDFFVFRF